MRIAFLSPAFPTPPLRGFQVRAYHQLRLLARRHRVSLVCFAGELDPAARATVASFCEDLVTVPLRRRDALVGVVRAALDGRPLQTGIYDAPEMQDAIRALRRRREFDVVHVQLARMASQAEHFGDLPTVIDFVDALSHSMRERVDRDPSLLGLAARFEIARLERYERALCERSARATVVSEADRAAIGDLAGLVVNSSGVDLERFRPAPERRQPLSLVFTGNLGYFANVDAVRWFAEEVLPLVFREVPGASLTLAGARPSARVRALARRDGRIRVVGFVADMAGVLASAAVAVVPVRSRHGQLLKVLEAFASGTPVVSTAAGLGGIAAQPGRHALVAERPEEFAAQIVRLLREPDRAAEIGAAARKLVEERYTWERSVEELEAIYESIVHAPCALAHASRSMPRARA